MKQETLERRRSRAGSVSPTFAAWAAAFGKFALFVLLAGFILFAHGCHGDEDNELFTAAISAFR